MLRNTEGEMAAVAIYDTAAHAEAALPSVAPLYQDYVDNVGKPVVGGYELVSRKIRQVVPG